MPRSLEVWVGVSDDSAIPPRVRLRVFDRAAGRCALCGRKLTAADCWQVDHIVALINGGANREDNLRCVCSWCHRTKSIEDVAQKAKSYRIRLRHTGIKPPKRKIRSRSSFAVRDRKA